MRRQRRQICAIALQPSARRWRQWRRTQSHSANIAADAAAAAAAAAAALPPAMQSGRPCSRRRRRRRYVLHYVLDSSVLALHNARMHVHLHVYALLMIMRVCDCA